ncbi:hypothetical protein MP638_002356, partial [Amoeboaphelidium occidentale]
AIHTRQDTNNNNDRYGFECPEERDFFPWFGPTPWRDVWVCTDETFRCPYYQSNSQNVMNKGNCSGPGDYYGYYNNQQECEQNNGVWTLTGAFNVPPPECTACPYTRHNHNGNAAGDSDPPNYWWQIPTDIHADGTKCVLRLRYNISTYDFDGWSVDKSSNRDNSPIKNNQAKDFLGLGYNTTGPLRLAMDTSQFGRTFEDRSHVFIIRKRTPEMNNWIGSAKIWNLNVLGRRGNIQQTYPAVEYDFAPRKLTVNRNDFLHIQWTGSDANSQGNAGEGRAGTDRNNLVMVSSLGKNVPVNFNPADGSYPPDFFTRDRNKIVEMAFLNQTGCDTESRNTQADDNCKVLNAAPAYWNAGLVKVENVGTFHFISTRNNNFSNRDQKGTLIVEEDWTSVAVGSAVGVAGIGAFSGAFLLLFAFAKKNPDSKVNKVLGIYKPVYVPEFDEEEQEQVLPIKEKKTLVERLPFLRPLFAWYEWEQGRIVFFILFFLANAAFWLYGMISNWNHKTKLPYYPYAKGFGKMLDLNCSFILIPVLRNFLSFLRSTAANDVLPLDDNIKIHKWCAYMIILATGGHVTFHYLNFIYANNYLGLRFVDNSFGTLPGVTGHLVLLLMFFMYSTAFIKRKIFRIFGRRYDGYRVFLGVHKLYIPVLVLLFLHSERFWQFCLYPALFLALEKFIQNRRVSEEVVVVEAKLVGKDILNIKMRLKAKSKKFRYKPGQYLFLTCPELSEGEVHAFTISSGMGDDYFSVHIRARPDMDFCYRLRQRFGFADTVADDGTVIPAPMKPITESQNADLAPELRVDGPYGSASEEVFDFNVTILVGAGIGVTPFISILKSFSYKMKHQTAQENSNMSIYFYWICRDQAEYMSFKDVFDELLDNNELHGRVELNIYLTGELDLKKVRQEKFNQFSGKPNWNRIMKEKAQKHEGDDVGVFLCGPGAKDLSYACKMNSKGQSRTSKTTFKFHKENF